MEDRPGAQQVPAEGVVEEKGAREGRVLRKVCYRVPSSLSAERTWTSSVFRGKLGLSPLEMDSFLSSPLPPGGQLQQASLELGYAWRMGHMYLGHQGILLLLQGPEAAPAETQLSQ